MTTTLKSFSQRKKEFVFVYGTLMSCHRNHFYLDETLFLGEGKVEGLALFDVTPHFPGAVRDNSGTVLGEVYEVDFKTFKELDRLESNGYLYLREKFNVLLDNGDVVEAWTYLWLKPLSGKRVPLGKQPWRKEKRRCS
jgi:gamma-glutamylcyclotransferase (GGCT)/AIG2-like uncharacterized protein YtfP